MSAPDELVLALRTRDALRARVLYAQLIASDLLTIERPSFTDEVDLAIAASIVELIAARCRPRHPLGPGMSARRRRHFYWSPFNYPPSLSVYSEKARQNFVHATLWRRRTSCSPRDHV